MTSTLPDAENYWSDMLKVYAKNGVSQACLSLQDRFSIDVILFLTTLIACQKGCLIDDQAVSRLDAACAQWRAQIVHPLRLIRQQLKNKPLSKAKKDAHVFREKIKALELNAEKLQLNLLHDVLIILHWDKTKDVNQSHLSDTGRMVLQYFHKDPLSEHLPEVILIIAAVRSVLDVDLKASS